jgi:hypothetical protein
MDLIVSLSQDDLVAIEAELSAKYTYETRTKKPVCDLNAISLLDFCNVILKYLYSKDMMTVYSYVRQLRLICHIFDAIDVDSRGVIAWTDFTAFCLRMGRVYLNASSVFGGDIYIQSPTFSCVLPIRSLFYVKHSGQLYAIDNDTPTIRAFRDNGAYTSKFNPIRELERMKKVQENSGSISMSLAARRQKKEAVVIAVEKQKILLTAACYLEKYKKLVLCASDGCVIFCIEAEGNQHVSGFAMAEVAQVGTCFCPESDLLVTWPGEVSDHKFHVWDPIKMKLLYHVARHSDLVLSACDVNLRSINPDGYQHKDHVEVDYVASSSLDRKVLLWPITALTNAQSKPNLAAPADGAVTSYSSGNANGNNNTSKMNSSIIELTGHKFVMRSLVYAKEHELIVGAGFDYDIYAWDPWTRLLTMKLSGHLTSLLCVRIANIPHERMISLDESGIIKIWNFGPKHSTNPEMLQSMQLNPATTEKQKMIDFVVLGEGNTFAILASSRVYQFQ